MTTETCPGLVIPLTRGLVTVVDQIDYDWASKVKWHAGSAGRPGRKPMFYAANGKLERLHRLGVDTTSDKHER